MKWSQNVDDQIKQALANEAEKMQGDQQLYYQIREQIYLRGREKNMKNKRMGKKVILVGISTVLLATGTIFAARVNGWDMKLLDFYGEYPTKEQIKEEGGFLPKFVEELPGGYTFMMSSTHKGELIDEYNHVNDEGNEFALRYFAPGKENQEHAIAFFATDILEHVGASHLVPKVTIENEGILLEFADWTKKYVSSNYEMTEEEQKQIDDGVLFIEETKDDYLLKEGIERKQMISWFENGIGYTLLSANNYQFTQEEFVEMAKAVIDSE